MEWSSRGVGFRSAPPPVEWHAAGVEFKARPVWREVLHPRDWRGRFTDRPGGGPVGEVTPSHPSGNAASKPITEAVAKVGKHQLKIVESLGLHKSKGIPPLAYIAANRLLAKKPLTAPQVDALASVLRKRAEAADSTPTRREALHRLAARLSATSWRINGISPSAVPSDNLGRVAPGDIKPGDRLALPGIGGAADRRTVVSAVSHYGLVELMVEDDAGQRERRFLAPGTEVYRVPAAVEALKVHPAKAADMKLGKGDKPAALYTGAGPGVGPGAVGPGQQWYDVLASAGYSSKPIPVTGLVIEGHTVTDGLAFRKADISYLVEKKPGESDADALARAEKGAGILQGVLFSVPADKRKLQRGMAMLEAKNPADSLWEKKYNMPGFTSNATGGSGGTTVWGGKEPQPTTLAHEFGHTLDSSLFGTGQWLSDANGPVIPGQQISWKQARLYDEDLSGIFTDFEETRKGGSPITPGKSGVSPYGEKSGHEDFAESVRLWMKDKREGRIGYLKSTLEDVRFSDLFPERAKILDAAFETNPNYDTPIRKRLRKEAEDKFFESFKANDADPFNFPLTAGTLLKSGLPLEDRQAVEVAAKERFAKWKKDEDAKKAAEQAAAKLAAEQAAAKAKAAAKVESIKAALQAGRLEKADAAKLRMRVWRYKKKLREQGYSESDIAKMAAVYESEQLHAFLGLDDGFSEPWKAALVSPGFQEADRAAGQTWLLKAGKEVHPLANSQFSTDSQAKANIAAELSKRVVDNPEFLERYKHYKVTYGGWPTTSFEGISEEGLRKEIAQEISSRVSTWAETSGDSEKEAVLMQQAVKEEFGLSAPAAPTASKEEFDEWMEDWDYVGGWYRAVARVMYENTQEEFAKSGITHVSLYRGMKFYTYDADVPEWAMEGPPRRVALQPINSWSTNLSTSKGFASGGSHSIMMKAQVPVDLIIGSALTGFGCLNEYEFVVFDNEGLVDVQVLHSNL